MTTSIKVSKLTKGDKFRFQDTTDIYEFRYNNGNYSHYRLASSRSDDTNIVWHDEKVIYLDPNDAALNRDKNRYESF
jgi:hypothetical protein